MITLPLLHELHALNRWLMLGTGSLSLALLLFAVWRPRFSPALVTRVFVGTLHLQVVLGLLIFAVHGTLHLPIFGGSPVAWWHMGGGLFAALMGTLALFASRRSPRPWLAALCCALALLGVGKIPIMLTLLAVFLLVAWLWPRQNTVGKGELNIPTHGKQN